MLPHSSSHLRFIRAQRIGREHVSGHRPCARPGAAAEIAELAVAALAVEPRRIAKGRAQLARLIDLAKRLFLHVSRLQRKEAGGKYVADVRDEHEAFALVDTPRR